MYWHLKEHFTGTYNKHLKIKWKMDKCQKFMFVPAAAIASSAFERPLCLSCPLVGLTRSTVRSKYCVCLLGDRVSSENWLGGGGPPWSSADRSRAAWSSASKSSSSENPSLSDESKPCSMKFWNSCQSFSLVSTPTLCKVSFATYTCFFCLKAKAEKLNTFYNNLMENSKQLEGTTCKM